MAQKDINTVHKENIMLSRVICLIIISSCLFGCSKNDTAPTQSKDSTKPGQTDSSAWKIDGYTLIWQDEFNGPAVEASKWVCEIGNNNGWGNNELEYYTNRPENVKIDNGNLIITAKKESYSGKDYTSARLKTQGKFSCKYGKIESRIKLPYGQGIWPAFWMLGTNISTVGWPKCGEIDIMEMIGGSGSRDRTVYGTAHWDNNGHQSYGKNYSTPSGKFADGYHKFAITWDAKKIVWSFDDVEYCTLDITSAALSAFQENYFILLNLAIGGNWPGNPDSATVFPQTMSVDYVRVYRKNIQ
jgi:beta-glucanase (GH16 family)